MAILGYQLACSREGEEQLDPLGYPVVLGMFEFAWLGQELLVDVLGWCSCCGWLRMKAEQYLLLLHVMFLGMGMGWEISFGSM